MFVQVRCQNIGHDGRRRAGRHFMNGRTYRMEVVDQKDDFRAGGDGPGDMEKINRVGLEAIKADPCFSVSEGDPVALAEAVVKVAAMQAEIDRLKAENAELKAAAAGGKKADEHDEKPKGAKGK